MKITLDHEDLRPIIEQAVDAAVRRLRDEAPTDEAGRILLTKRQAADRLGVSLATVDRLRGNHGLPCVKLDGLVLFRPASLDAWAAQREVANK